MQENILVTLLLYMNLIIQGTYTHGSPVSWIQPAMFISTDEFSMLWTCIQQRVIPLQAPTYQGDWEAVVNR